MIGDLCHSKNGNALVYKSTVGALVYKSDVQPPTAGNITVVVVSSQSVVGPIASCGNTHNVAVELDGASGTGQVSREYAAGARTIPGSTQSSGCAYPEENPPVVLTIAAIQQASGKSFTTTVNIPNVATGAYSVSITVDVDNILTGVTATAL